jgi:hypothetical protein
LLLAIDHDSLERARHFGTKVLRANYVALRMPYFSWQFSKAAELFGNGEDPGTWLYESDGVPAGISLASKTPLIVDGKRLVGAWHHDWYADPDQPGGGLALIRRQFKNNPVLASCGQSLEAANVLHRMRPSRWFELRRLYRILDVNRTIALFADPSPALFSLLKLYADFVRSESVREIQVLEFDAQYDRVWINVSRDFSFASDRSAAFMNWRYLQHPEFTYQVYLFPTSAGPAYLIWREEQIHGGEGLVARLCEAIGTTDAIALAGPNLWRMLTARGITLADFYCSNSEVNAALIAGGMRSVVTLPDFDLPRLFSPLAADVRKTINVNIAITPDLGGAWFNNFDRAYITKGDSNQDRPNLD